MHTVRDSKKDRVPQGGGEIETEREEDKEREEIKNKGNTR